MALSSRQPRSASIPSTKTAALGRRDFLVRAATGAAAAGLATTSRGATAPGSGGAGRPVLMKAGHQHDHSAPTLRALAAFGVTHICSGRLSRQVEKDWSVDALTRLRRHVESFGLRLECVPLPMTSAEIKRAEMPEILLARDPERDRAIADVCQMIRNAGRAGIPMVKYNLTLIGVVRTGRTPGRGGASLSTFDYARTPQEPPLTEAGRVTEEIYWDRITYFLKRVVPAAEEAKVKIACHPQDPGMPRDTGWRGVNTVLGSVDGLRRFVETVPSRFHGLNFCQGTVSEMLANPATEICDVIRDFGARGKIFNVHFRNIRGGFLRFEETLPDDGDVDMPAALRVYRDVGYDGMIMPDHVPQIEGDPGGHKAFAFCHGYIQALLQRLRSESPA